jgi:Protein of unknown function, DUF488
MRAKVGAAQWSGATPALVRIGSDLRPADALPTPRDGEVGRYTLTRILIDRLWPRSVNKADAAIDEWMEEIAPSTALRKWFGHDVGRWDEFRRR